MESNEIVNLLKCSQFSMLKGKIDTEILDGLIFMGYERPTEIQAKTLPFIIQGKDVIGAAKTGSGKTLAFLIPVLDMLLKLKFTKNLGTGCIILTPTRELALQIFEVLNKLLSNINLSSALIVGGEKKLKEAKLLKEGVNIIVATPGRLLDHLSYTKDFTYKNLRCLVVDEADRLLDAGFEKHINGIIKKLPKNRQTVLFSATIDDKVKNLAKLAMRSSPVLVSVKDNKCSTVKGLRQGYYVCDVEDKMSWLFKMLKKIKKLKVMVFFASCKLVDFHYEFFKNHCGASVIKIHGQQSQAKRKAAYHSFVESKNGTLFCTDVAARGLDIPLVDWIIQYDPPTDAKEYIHRVGRTARGISNRGNAVILLRPEDLPFVEFLENEKVYLDKLNFTEPTKEVQVMLEELVENNGLFKTLARKAYFSFVRCYKTHNLKKIFNIKTLNLKSAGKAFGFRDPPHVDLKSV